MADYNKDDMTEHKAVRETENENETMTIESGSNAEPQPRSRRENERQARPQTSSRYRDISSSSYQSSTWQSMVN